MHTIVLALSAYHPVIDFITFDVLAIANKNSSEVVKNSPQA